MAKKGKKKGGKKDKKEKKSEAPKQLAILAKIDELEQELKRQNDREEKYGIELEAIQKDYEELVKIQEACANHLKRRLLEEVLNEGSLRDQLKFVSDTVEFGSMRMKRQFEDNDRKRDIRKGMFDQRKAVLEAQLSLLEELRLQRISLQAKIKRYENQLIERSETMKSLEREADVNLASVLRSRLEQFLSGMQNFVSENEEVFEHRLKVYNETRLKDNVEVREQCASATQALLHAQKRREGLKQLEKSLQFERDIVGYSENRSRKIASQYENKIASLEEETARNVPTGLEKVIKKHQTDIKTATVELSHLEDKNRDIGLLLSDQNKHIQYLKVEIKNKIDRNGLLTSLVHRAGKVFKNRCCKTATTYKGPISPDILEQLRILLDKADEFAK